MKLAKVVSIEVLNYIQRGERFSNMFHVSLSRRSVILDYDGNYQGIDYGRTEL